MVGVRALQRDDLPEVAELYRKLLSRDEPSHDRIIAYLNKVLFENPWQDTSLPSYVYQQGGRIAGCIGVVPRRMRLNGCPLKMAVTCHFMVDPVARATMAGIDLLRKVLQGPQDLSVAEGNDISRKLWTGLGGTVSVPRSIFWIRVLRPGGYGLLQLKKRAVPKFLTTSAAPFCSLADVLATRIKWSPFRMRSYPQHEEFADETLLELLREFVPPEALRPEYDLCSWRWLVDLVNAKPGAPPRKALVRKHGKVAGWYVLKLSQMNICTAVQVGGRPGNYAELFREMSYQAWRDGAVTLVGRVEPRFFQELPQHLCVLRKGAWMLVHARNPTILRCFDDTDAFFTSLEGEWAVIP
jgi:Acetyltransferase (GNAT) domain